MHFFQLLELYKVTLHNWVDRRVGQMKSRYCRYKDSFRNTVTAHVNNSVQQYSWNATNKRQTLDYEQWFWQFYVSCHIPFILTVKSRKSTV